MDKKSIFYPLYLHILNKNCKSATKLGIKRRAYILHCILKKSQRDERTQTGVLTPGNESYKNQSAEGATEKINNKAVNL